MLNRRFEWNCSDPGCCVFMGGTDKFDIYMGECHKRPHDPEVLFLTGCGADFSFANRADMECWVKEHGDVCDCPLNDECTCAAHFPSDEEKADFITAVLFVRLFFPMGDT
jgi:hypothetical protein